jgi:hypothetical protein
MALQQSDAFMSSTPDQHHEGYYMLARSTMGTQLDRFAVSALSASRVDISLTRVVVTRESQCRRCYRTTLGPRIGTQPSHCLILSKKARTGRDSRTNELCRDRWIVLHAMIVPVVVSPCRPE